MSDTPQTLEARIRRYVAALASSGNNFVVKGEQMPVSQELQNDYVKSILGTFSAYLDERQLPLKKNENVPLDRVLRPGRYSKPAKLNGQYNQAIADQLARNKEGLL